MSMQREPGGTREREAERFRRAERDRPAARRDPVTREPTRPTDPLSPPPPDWRDEVLTASGLNVLAGIWLIIAPFVLGYSDGDPYWNDIVFGAIIAVLALARVSGAYRMPELSWINALIGAWIFVSAFWLDDSARASWNDVILGIVVFVLAISSATASEAATSPRWRR